VYHGDCAEARILSAEALAAFGQLDDAPLLVARQRIVQLRAAA
jgi:hypothetical protein